ncbi:ankyrin repeat domain-containing 45 isoform X1 [Pelobates cultripes]|uniref:Ankyrin repeat domain-containing 45 isoform X1 n=1 Tax=Pelobates cultripes TaxID=61616 RepID=A0AAD1SU08_PELCU|nr:ankyrin repeat domain-containing 45 isoform X1 [Pelobates cultripes]
MLGTQLCCIHGNASLKFCNLFLFICTTVSHIFEIKGGNGELCARCESNAAGTQNEQASQWLLEQDMLGRNALFFACIAGHDEIVKELVKNGANVKQKTARGYSPLHCSAAWGQLEVLKALVDLGSDIMAVNFLGEKACDIASRYNKTECSDFLTWAEAKLSLKAYILLIQQTMADPEKIPGKLRKDQKLQINSACKTKSEWLEYTKNPSTQDFMEQKQQLEATVQGIFAKLNTPRAENVKPKP